MLKGNTLLGNMLKEEWRMQSSIFGNNKLFFLPLVIFIVSFFVSLSIMFFKFSYSLSSIFLFIHYLFFLFGASIGGFGILGKEIMNRRFGQASLLAYSSRTLPISERKIFSVFIIKDLIYYFVFWIIPFTLGLISAMPFLGISLANVPLMFVSLFLSFLLGMSLVFLFSMLYANLGKFVIGAVFILIAAAIIISGIGFSFLPSWEFYRTGSFQQLILSLSLIFVMCALSVMFVKFDFPLKKKLFENSLIRIAKQFSFSRKNKLFWAKDYLDMKRSDGGFGKIIFSLLIPVLLILSIAPILSSQIPVEEIIFFSIFLGIISNSTYNALTQYDLFNQYLFLPVKVSTIIKSKLLGYSIINSVLLIVIVVLGFIQNNALLIAPSLILYLISSYFCLAVTIYNTGLSPTSMLMNPKLFLKYLIILIPFLVTLVLMYFLGIIFFIIGSVLLVLLTLFIFSKALKKWDYLPQQVF
jgi:hypothetical protein